jgi:hypothetical protein
MLGKNFIGQELLAELDVFRKTYIILWTHLGDCSKQMKHLYDKYVRLMLRSVKHAVNNGILDVSNESLVDLIISIGCENAINGYIYPKLWPSILKMNAHQDELIQFKSKQLVNYLKLNCDENATIEKLNSIRLCAEYFQIDKKYFLLSYSNISSELNRLALLNNPFEKLQCIKASIDLINSELTLFSMTNSHTEQDDQDEESQINKAISSDLLVPLIAFILVKSNINCLQSIIYFVEEFGFSSQVSKHSKSSSSSMLTELAFFLTTFKAAIQVISAFNL